MKKSMDRRQSVRRQGRSRPISSKNWSLIYLNNNKVALYQTSCEPFETRRDCVRQASSVATPPLRSTDRCVPLVIRSFDPRLPLPITKTWIPIISLVAIERNALFSPVCFTHRKNSEAMGWVRVGFLGFSRKRKRRNGEGIRGRIARNDGRRGSCFWSIGWNPEEIIEWVNRDARSEF